MSRPLTAMACIYAFGYLAPGDHPSLQSSSICNDIDVKNVIMAGQSQGWICFPVPPVPNRLVGGHKLAGNPERRRSRATRAPWQIMSGGVRTGSDRSGVLAIRCLPLDSSVDHVSAIVDRAFTCW
jgi:hypothetical protein